jgi:hypothetical protein
LLKLFSFRGDGVTACGREGKDIPLLNIADGMIRNKCRKYEHEGHHLFQL